MDPDVDIFVCDLKITTKKFFAYYFLKVDLHNFSKIKSHNELQNIRNQRFFITIFASW